jgi:hypothetical protein
MAAKKKAAARAGGKIRSKKPRRNPDKQTSPIIRKITDFTDDELAGAKVHSKFGDETVTRDALTVKREHERHRRALAEGYVSVDPEVKWKRKRVDAHVKKLREDIAALKPHKRNAAAVSESLQSVEATLGLVEIELAIAVSEGAFDHMDLLLKEARSMYSSIFLAGIAVPALEARHEQDTQQLVRQQASIAERQRRKKAVSKARDDLARILGRDATQPELLNYMIEHNQVRKGEKGRFYVYDEQGRRVGKALPAGTYPLKDIVRDRAR